VVVPPARRAGIEARPPGHPGVGVRQGRRRSLAARPESISPGWDGLSQRTRARTIAETTTRCVFLTDSDTSIVQRSMTPSRSHGAKPRRNCLEFVLVVPLTRAMSLGASAAARGPSLERASPCWITAWQGRQMVWRSVSLATLSSWVVIPDLIADHSGLLCATWCSPPRR